MQRKFMLPVVALLAAAACNDTMEPETPELQLEPAFASENASEKASDMRTYEVTITNLTGGQPLTPPAAATHRRAIDAYEVGQPASFGVKEIAENGNLDPFVMALQGSKDVSDAVVAVAGDPPPLFPGASVTFEIEAGDGAQFFSFVSMLICTNDGFTGLDAVKLPNQVGASDSWDAYAYDAGTEINTEDFADIVPPCPALTGVPSTDPGTGMSNPALAENGVIAMHPGITGDDDLIAGLHGWSGPVARVTIERLD
jgi:hypothetical protein